MMNDLFKRPRHLVQQSVERMLKQMLKPFKRAFSQPQEEECGIESKLFSLIEKRRSFSISEGSKGMLRPIC